MRVDDGRLRVADEGNLPTFTWKPFSLACASGADAGMRTVRATRNARRIHRLAYFRRCERDHQPACSQRAPNLRQPGDDIPDCIDTRLGRLHPFIRKISAIRRNFRLSRPISAVRVRDQQPPALSPPWLVFPFASLKDHTVLILSILVSSPERFTSIPRFLKRRSSSLLDISSWREPCAASHLQDRHLSAKAL